MMELNDEKERRLGDDGSREGDGQSGRQGPREESLASGPQADRVGRASDCAILEHLPSPHRHRFQVEAFQDGVDKYALL